MGSVLKIVATLGLLLFPQLAWAQLFSPGKLARPHAHLEGLKQCTQCHPSGGKLSEDLCLKCHEEIRTRVDKKSGYHGRLNSNDRACEKCHHDHQGLDFAMIELDPKRFDHRSTGWNLAGAHQKLKCAECHETRRIRDGSVRRLLTEHGAKKTYLGLGTQCLDCHFDEHRGQLSTRCQNCHDEANWKPAKGFDHAKTDYPLRGKHGAVKCVECHATEKELIQAVFPKSVADTFARYVPVAHEQCSSCHEDPHQGRFGEDCAACHSEDGWRVVKAATLSERTFHDQTRYPLRGQHSAVKCDACHRPLNKNGLVYRGLPFGRCADCHVDAHSGQVKGDCDGCHQVAGFSPVRYEIETHAQTRYPLLGQHQAVACGQCHTEGPKPKLSKALELLLRKRKRSPPLSGVKLALGQKGPCLACHKDPHAGQFEAQVKAQGCESCHQVSGFADLRFDHDASRFPLTGKHREATCGACHQASASEKVVRYRPLPLDCQGCHQDVHRGQLPDCKACHQTLDFKQLTFDHAKTRFPLTGKHAPLECEKCHRKAQIEGSELVVYRPLPLDCAGCHADFHQGAFERYAQ